MKNFLEVQYAKFRDKLIPDFFDNYEYSYKGVKVHAKAITENIIHNIDYNQKSATGMKKNKESLLSIDLTIKNTSLDRDESIQEELEIPLCLVPQLTEKGFVRGGTAYQAVSKLSPASGWFLKDDPEEKDSEYMSYLNPYGEVLRIFFHKGVPYVGFVPRGKSNINKQDKIDVFMFLKALTGMSYNQILTRINNPCMLAVHSKVLKDEKSVEDCACRVRNSMTGRKFDNCNYETIVEDFLSFFARNTRGGVEKIPRFKSMNTFNRFIRSEVLELEPCDEKYIGKIISRQLANEMDELHFSKALLKNIDNEMVVDIKITELSEDNLSITADEFIVALNNLFLYHFHAIGSIDSDNDYGNQVSTSIDQNMLLEIKKIMFKIEDEIFEKAAEGGHALSSINKKKITDLFKGGPPSIMYEIMHRGVNKLNDIFVQPDGSNSLSLSSQSSKIIKIPLDELRKIHPTQIGLIDCYDTPESAKVGLSVSVCSHTEVDKYNMLCQPLYKVFNGKVDTSKIYMINAVGLRSHVVALYSDCDEFTGLVTDCVLDGHTEDANFNDIDYKMVYPDQTQSPVLNSACYTLCNGTKRLYMAPSALKSASPCIKPERPWNTSSGMSDDIGIWKGHDILEKYLLNNGKDADKMPSDVYLRIMSLNSNDDVIEARFTLHHEDGSEYNVSGIRACDIKLSGITNSISKTIQEYKYNPPVSETGMYSLTDIVFFSADVDMISRELQRIDGTFCKSDHDVALGQNVKVMFKLKDGYNYEDANIVNERFANKLGLATLQVFAVRDDNFEDKKQEILYEYQEVSGLPEKGTYLYPDDIVINRWFKNSETGVVKEKPIRLKAKEEGLVLSTRIDVDGNKTCIEVLLCNTLKLQPGDKISGCHGNKSVVSIIVPEEDMEYDETGQTPDIILNPQGIIQRENTGQVLEELEFEVARKNNIVKEIEPCSSFDIGKMCEEAKNIDVVPTIIYNPHTGEAYPNKALIGTLYMMRSTHVSASKYNATNTASDMINLVSYQPNKGAGGGQRKGEMEMWCWWAAGATKLAQIMSTLQSDDPTARNKLKTHFEKNPLVPYGSLENQQDENYSYGTVSTNIERLQAWHRFIGFDMESDGDSYQIVPLTNRRIEQISQGSGMIDPRDVGVDSSTLRSKDIFGSFEKGSGSFDSVKDNASKYSCLKLPSGYEVIMPTIMTSQAFSYLIHGYHIDSNTDANVLKPLSTKTMSSLCIGGNIYVGLTNIIHNPTNPSEYVNKVFVVTKDPTHISIDLGVTEWAHTHLEFFKLLQNYEFDSVVSNVKQNATKAETEILNQNYSTADMYNTVLNFAKNFGHPKNLLVNKVLVAPVIYRPVNSKGQACGTLCKATEELYSAILNKGYSSRDNLWKTLCNVAGIKFSTGNNKKIEMLNCIKGLTDHASRSSVYRDTLLAKNVNFSGRSVITPNPHLKLGTAGIPIKILIKIFAYHLYGLVKDSDGCLAKLSGVRENSNRTKVLIFKKFEHVITSIANDNISIAANRKIFNNSKEELIEFLNKLGKIYPVELNRAPSLWKNSTGFFKFIPIDGNTIQLHPLVCPAYNADFDGDQMAIDVPMHIEAIKDSAKLISGRDIRNEHDGDILYSINQDMILGCYYYTSVYNNNVIKHMLNTTKDNLDMFTGEDDFISCGVKELYDLIELNQLKICDEVIIRVDDKCYRSSAGRIIFNSLFGSYAFTEDKNEDGTYKLKYDEVINKSSIARILDKFVEEMYVKHADELKSENDLIDNATFDYNTCEFISGDTIFESIFDIVLDGARKFYLNTIDRIKSFGFYSASMSGITLSLYDFNEVKHTFDAECTAIFDATKDCEVLESLEEHQLIAQSESRNIRADTWSRCEDDVTKRMKEAVPKGSNLYNIIESGARGNYSNIVRICGMVGMVKDSDGNPTKMPIRSPYISGLSAIESQQNAFNGRNVQIATQMGAPITGVATRNMVYLNDHSKTSNSKDYCNSESTTLPLKYKVDINIPDLRLNMEPISSWSGQDKDDWKLAMELINKLQGSLLISEEVRNLISIFDKLSVIDSDNNSIEVSVNDYCTIDLLSKRRLLYRCIDIERMLGEGIIDNIIADKIKESCREIDGNFYITSETSNLITGAHLRKVYIWTIINCSASDGTICKRCYGLSAKTLCLSEDSLFIGVLAAQAIGKEEMQGKMDSHKAGIISVSADSKTIIEYPMRVGDVSEDIRRRKIKKLAKDMITTLKPNSLPNRVSTVVFHNYQALEFLTEKAAEEYKSDSCYHIFVDRFSMLENIPISKLPVGTPVVKNSSTKEQMLVNGFLSTAVNLWYDYMSAVNVEFDARMFEVVIRNLSETVVITNVSDDSLDYHVGEIIPRYLIQPEDKDKITYTNLILGRRQAIQYSRKVLANVVWQNCKKGLSYASLNRIRAPKNSLIDLSTLGEVSGKRHPIEITKHFVISNSKIDMTELDRTINNEFDLSGIPTRRKDTGDEVTPIPEIEDNSIIPEVEDISIIPDIEDNILIIPEIESEISSDYVEEPIHVEDTTEDIMETDDSTNIFG